jgi:hypothetical protein
MSYVHNYVSSSLKQYYSINDIACSYFRTGEVLPPVFNYFHFKPDFIRQNDHIATRLCEADKHAIQSYIDGKMTVYNMTAKEKEDRLEKECIQLRELAEQRKNALEEEKQRTKV